MKGVYSIECSVDNKIYIGSSVNIDQRWSNHKKDLKKGTHHSYLLQIAWDKFGGDNFIFSVLEETEDMYTREQFYMDKYKSHDKNFGYNICPIAGMVDVVQAKYYIVTRPNGEEIEVYNMHEFCRNENINLRPECMTRVATGWMNQHRKYKCRYKGVSVKEWEKTRIRQNKSGPKTSWKGQWEIKFPDGKIEIINTLTSFCKNNNLSEHCMHKVADGKCYYHKGFMCRRLDGVSSFRNKPTKIYVITTPSGEELQIENLTKFCKSNNLSRESMVSLCTSKRDKSHKGYTCKRIYLEPNNV
jgi:group I intron endonuclease